MPPLAVSEVVSNLVFPLVLLLVGGALTGYVYPRVTAARQRDEKGREVRTALVSDMSEEVTEILMAVQFAALGSATQSQADFDGAYKRWEIASAVIGTKIEAYFPDQGLGARWTAFTDRVTRFYALVGIPDAGQRAAQRGQLLGEPADERDEQAEWLRLRDRLLDEKRAIIRDVISGKGMKL